MSDTGGISNNSYQAQTHTLQRADVARQGSKSDQAAAAVSAGDASKQVGAQQRGAFVATLSPPSATSASVNIDRHMQAAQTVKDQIAAIGAGFMADIGKSLTAGAKQAGNDSGVANLAGTSAKLAEGKQASMAALFMIMGLMAEIVDENKEVAKTDIENKTREQEKLHKERIDNIMESIEAQEEAEKSGVFGQVFGFITSALSIIGGILTAAVGVLTGQPQMVASGLLFAAGGICGLASEILTLCGEEDAAEVLGYASLACTGAALLVITAGAAASVMGAGGAGAAAAKGATSASVQGLKTASTVTDAVAGATTAATAGTNMHTAGLVLEAEEARAQGKEVQAQQKALEAALSMIQAFIQAQMQSLMTAIETVSTTEKNQAETNRFILSQTV